MHARACRHHMANWPTWRTDYGKLIVANWHVANRYIPPKINKLFSSFKIVWDIEDVRWNLNFFEHPTQYLSLGYMGSDWEFACAWSQGSYAFFLRQKIPLYLIFCVILWQLRVKGCLEVPGFEFVTLWFPARCLHNWGRCSSSTTYLGLFGRICYASIPSTGFLISFITF